MLWWLRIRASFFCLESCLIAYSLFIASCFVSYSSKYTSSTGRRFFVYLAPFPLLCASSLFLRLFVQPVYRVSSLHFTMYVWFCLSVSFIIFYQLSLFYCFLFYFSIVLSFCLFYDFLLQFINSNFLLFPATTFYRKHFII